MPRSQSSPSEIVRVAPKHHFLVRLTHWVNVPLLLGLTVSGLAIYWAAPVFRHAPNRVTGSDDYLADVGVWAVRHLPGQSGYGMPKAWLYDHASIGTFALASALRLHWFFAYLFMANGLLYVLGLVAGGGYRSLLPRRSDPADAFRMIRYYAGFLPAKLLRRPWPHPPVAGKYNALQRGAYLSMPILGLLAIGSGWAMHKPSQLGWLERLFGSYDTARIWHFGVMCAFVAFVLPHVVLVIADGWDTFRSMVVGWSRRTVEGAKHPRSLEGADRG